MTLTEALQETKTIKERVAKKRERLIQFVCRTGIMKDRLESEGGESEHLGRELQAIRDLENRLLEVRAAIYRENSVTFVDVEGDMRTIESWLAWKRDIIGPRRLFIERRENFERKASEVLWGKA